MIKKPSIPSIPTEAWAEKIGALTTVHKAIIYAVTLIAIVAAFYFLSYKDKAQDIQDLQKKVSQQEKRLAELKKAAREVKKLQAELVEAEKKLEELLTLLPDQKEIPGLLENVSRLRAEEGLENRLFQPQKEVNSEFYASIPVRVDLAGSYNNLAKFFEKVSNLERILQVEKLNITRKRAKRESTAGIQASFTLVTYRFLKPEETQSDDEKGKKGKKSKKKKKKKKKKEEE